MASVGSPGLAFVAESPEDYVRQKYAAKSGQRPRSRSPTRSPEYGAQLWASVYSPPETEPVPRVIDPRIVQGQRQGQPWEAAVSLAVSSATAAVQAAQLQSPGRVERRIARTADPLETSEEEEEGEDAGASLRAGLETELLRQAQGMNLSLGLGDRMDVSPTYGHFSAAIESHTVFSESLRGGKDQWGEEGSVPRPRPRSHNEGAPVLKGSSSSTPRVGSRAGSVGVAAQQVQSRGTGRGSSASGSTSRSVREPLRVVVRGGAATIPLPPPAKSMGMSRDGGVVGRHHEHRARPVSLPASPRGGSSIRSSMGRGPTRSPTGGPDAAHAAQPAHAIDTIKEGDRALAEERASVLLQVDLAVAQAGAAGAREASIRTRLECARTGADVSAHTAKRDALLTRLTMVQGLLATMQGEGYQAARLGAVERRYRKEARIEGMQARIQAMQLEYAECFDSLQVLIEEEVEPHRGVAEELETSLRVRDALQRSVGLVFGDKETSPSRAPSRARPGAGGLGKDLPALSGCGRLTTEAARVLSASDAAQKVMRAQVAALRGDVSPSLARLEELRAELHRLRPLLEIEQRAAEDAAAAVEVGMVELDGLRAQREALEERLRSQ